MVGAGGRVAGGRGVCGGLGLVGGWRVVTGGRSDWGGAVGVGSGGWLGWSLRAGRRGGVPVSVRVVARKHIGAGGRREKLVHTLSGTCGR
jgi:hypothetical protein